VNDVLRYSRGDNQNGLALTGMSYWADWKSSDLVPQRAIASGAISRFGLIDPSDVVTRRGKVSPRTFGVRRVPGCFERRRSFCTTR
jgi:hypothetical protein